MKKKKEMKITGMAGWSACIRTPYLLQSYGIAFLDRVVFANIYFMTHFVSAHMTKTDCRATRAQHVDITSSVPSKFTKLIFDWHIIVLWRAGIDCKLFSHGYRHFHDLVIMRLNQSIQCHSLNLHKRKGNYATFSKKLKCSSVILHQHKNNKWDNPGPEFSKPGCKKWFFPL